jgi:hypothetical protein
MAVVVEAVAYQESLIFWIEHKKLQLGLQGLRVVPVTTGGIAKNSRIIAMTKNLTSIEVGTRLHLHPRVRSMVQHQLIHWNPLTKNNVDDVIDVISYCWKVIKEAGYQILNPFELLEERTEASFGADLQLAF